ncbi:dihydroorotate dehydrogenase [Oribacterium sp. oral taxon 102]|uniref:dihydroorotate dehydrogenase n=1 Tax=Oribacterium sp. oral taxon 102 TaxID=671214 RepID=UPI0015BEF667|nr:dihydroorotate dehydrogenase [Oribacterium sp. oral taxon 102]NWO20334.1 dihydroorotate dehydrogenase [Oribacterium sp. oral taxon 102]
MVDISTELSGIHLDNPVIPASGTFGFGREFLELYDLNILGSISIKGTTVEPRYGNPLPRIAECSEGMLNAVGLQNPGAAQVCREELPELARHYRKPVLANISGFSVEEYCMLAERMEEADNVGWLELNVSCPNVHGGGLAFGTDPKNVAEVTREVKKRSTKPVYVKLSPNVTDIAEIARAAEDAGADGISLINTLLGMRIDIRSRRPVLERGMGGFSGPAVFPVAVRMVYQAAQAVKLPIIGIGGVSSASDVLEMMMAGASAVQVGAANLVNPYVCRDIIEELPEKCEELGIARIRDIIGIV